MRKAGDIPAFMLEKVKVMKQEFIEKINEAQYILIGIGSEFEKNIYQCEEKALKALRELKQILEEKNYYIVTTCTNDILQKAGFPEDKITCPCGTLGWKQCSNACEDSLQPLTDEEKKIADTIVDADILLELGKCAVCGEKLVLNNIHAKKYVEAGYLDSWKNYTQWLQRTLNRSVFVMELGVYWVFPTVIRLPFEKIVLYNQKAKMVRVNENLYYMTEEIKDKGISVEKNAIDWILEKDI